MPYNRGKLTKYKLLVAAPELKSALPATKKLSKSSFQSLLEQYGQIIVKPTGGWGGDGVIAISLNDSQSFTIHHGKIKHTVTGLWAAYAYIAKRTRGTTHLVQRQIRLAQVNGRPFDIRVMVQKQPRSKWKVTGRLAKVAGSGYIITNIARSKGKVVPLSEAIHASNISSTSSTQQLIERIDHIARKSAKHLKKYYRINTVGMDIGLDTSGKVWIIEPNFKPDITLFRKLKDRSVYRKIKNYGRKT